jgi:hypothetical protein
MAEQEMYDYLSDLVADYTTTELTVAPQQVITERGDKSQVVHKFDDGSVAVVSISDDNYFTVTLVWDMISKSDAGTIIDLWHDSSKANGRENTFYWDHPTDGHTYTVRFMDPLTRVQKAETPNYMEVSEVKLRVEGRKAEP